MQGGECQIIPKAKWQVLGKTPYDQDFVDEAVIAGATCGHPPPGPRPPELDAAPAPKVAPLPAPRKSLLDRFRRKSKPVAGTVEPVLTVPASLPQIGQPLPSPEPTPEPTPAVTQPARSPVDELLDPT